MASIIYDSRYAAFSAEDFITNHTPAPVPHAPNLYAPVPHAPNLYAPVPHAPYCIIIYDQHIWSSYMMIIYDDHI